MCTRAGEPTLVPAGVPRFPERPVFPQQLSILPRRHGRPRGRADGHRGGARLPRRTHRDAPRASRASRASRAALQRVMSQPSGVSLRSRARASAGARRRVRAGDGPGDRRVPRRRAGHPRLAGGLRRRRRARAGGDADVGAGGRSRRRPCVAPRAAERAASDAAAASAAREHRGRNPREHAPADPNFAAAAMSQADQWAAIQARQAASADAAARGAAAPPPQPQTPSPATGLLSQSLGVGVGHARRRRRRRRAPPRRTASRRDCRACTAGHGPTGKPISEGLSDFGLWGARSVGSAGESNGAPPRRRGAPPSPAEVRVCRWTGSGRSVGGQERRPRRRRSADRRLAAHVHGRLLAHEHGHRERPSAGRDGDRRRRRRRVPRVVAAGRPRERGEAPGGPLGAAASRAHSNYSLF